VERAKVLWPSLCGQFALQEESILTAPQKIIRCAIYARKSNEHNLDLEFNSLDAQRESCEAYIKSQMHEGWRLLPDLYEEGGVSAGSLDRPELQRLLSDIRAGKVDTVVVYKIDRLTRSLSDFMKLMELFEPRGVSFVSVTQAFNTTNSMGRLILHVLLSFAQFEREVGAERVRTRWQPPNARACGWGEGCRSAISTGTRSSSSCRKRPRRCCGYSGRIWK
jgi:hypothetical protein